MDNLQNLSIEQIRDYNAKFTNKLLGLVLDGKLSSDLHAEIINYGWANYLQGSKKALQLIEEVI